MYHGIRRYEALHRLWWLFFFLVCLFAARFDLGFTSVQTQNPELKDLGKIAFWTGLHGVGMSLPASEHSKGTPSEKSEKLPDKGKQHQETSSGQSDYRESTDLLRGALLFIVRVGTIFLGLRFLWLLIQYAGRYLLQAFISEYSHGPSTSSEQDHTSEEPSFSVQVIFSRIKRSPLSFLLHPFIRLRLILTGFHRYFSAEEILEKERRVVDSDWRILYGSWGPYRCLFWLLPLLGLAQTILLLMAQLSASSAGLSMVPSKELVDAAKPMLNVSIQKEIMESVKPTLNLLLPLIQAAGLAVFFQLAATILRYFEDLYLSGLDTFIYDRLLSNLPLRSNDTILILDGLQQRFKDLEAALKRIESRIVSRTKVEESS
jgi:hypothetical protein